MEIVVPVDYEYAFVLQLYYKFIADMKFIISTTDFTLCDVHLNMLLKHPTPFLFTRNILLFSLQHLKIVKMNTRYVIKFDNVVKYKGIRLITLLKIITYGNINFDGNPIVINEFKKLNTWKLDLYKYYQLSGDIT